MNFEEADKCLIYMYSGRHEFTDLLEAGNERVLLVPQTLQGLEHTLAGAF